LQALKASLSLNVPSITILIISLSNMFAQKLCVAFLTLALSSFAAQAAPQYHRLVGRDIFLVRLLFS
jgi:hypothetical protein